MAIVIESLKQRLYSSPGGGGEDLSVILVEANRPHIGPLMVFDDRHLVAGARVKDVNIATFVPRRNELATVAEGNTYGGDNESEDGGDTEVGVMHRQAGGW